MPSIDDLCVNTIRTLSMDAVQQANSGHPGAPMGLAPVAYTLFQEVINFDPAFPQWPNRDRFILSAGHASMLLYSILHLIGVKQLDADGKPTGELAVTLDQIKKFRQLHSRTPGHPESFITSGAETTTGPLGQGLGNSVGVAIAGRWLAQHFNKPNAKLFDYHVYTICGDGDLMEGISGEAASLAGHLKLSNLTWIYDSNRITIDGKTDLAFSEDVSSRFQGYRWNVLHVSDANDRGAIAAAIQVAKGTLDRPTLIIVDSHIGYGAPHKQDTSDAHGEPLGEDEVKAAKRFYGWPENEKFLVPDGVREHFAAGVGARGARAHQAWAATFERYKADHPDLARELELMVHRDLPAGWDQDLPTFPADAKGLATRDSGGKVLNALAKNVPWLIGGAADLAKSTKTTLKFDGAGDFSATEAGRNLHFGIREHVMGSVLNGLALSKLRPFGSGFLIFSDYGRPAIRLSALMGMPTIHVFTHDSIGVGEDGPTHQPIEQAMSLRAIPNMYVLRPGDANEVTECWKIIAKLQHSPTCLLLTRQALPTLDRTKYAPAAGVAKGGYVLADAAGGKPDVILIATGSEVPLCVEAYEKLTAEGIKARVVSLPSWELFQQQPQDYRDAVIPPSVSARVTVEMGTVLGWERYAGSTGTMLGMRTFGASAPLKDLLKEFGFSADAVYQAAKKQLGK
ncbi:MAG TPA: transketolase [Gemmataceae bacterium]|jgi:transketolase|nr:transketolase [Gemmataceae bacterium]